VRERASDATHADCTQGGRTLDSASTIAVGAAAIAVQLSQAAQNGCLDVVDRLLEDDRVDVAVAIQCSSPEDRKHFECRERLTEICIGLQDFALPAWVTVQILDAARPWSTLPLHSKWDLVCAVKHFLEIRNNETVWQAMCGRRVVGRHC
jgi:hypothetical protein